MDKLEFLQKRREFVSKTIDELLDSLSSKDLQTRFFAEMCLRDATSI